MNLKPHHHKYKNLILLTLGIIAAVVLFRNSGFHNFLLSLGNYGYISAFIAGALYASTFTVPIGAIILITLAKTLSPIELIIIALLGSVIFDVTVFKLVRHKISDEISHIYNNPKFDHHFKKLLHTKYFAWTLPLVGIFMIISPLPDELAIGLMGLAKIHGLEFLLISAISHAIGLSLIISASNLI